MNLNLNSIDRGGNKNPDESGSSKSSSQTQDRESPRTDVHSQCDIPQSPRFTGAKPTSHRGRHAGDAVQRRSSSGISQSTISDNDNLRHAIGLTRDLETRFKLGSSNASDKSNGVRGSALFTNLSKRLEQRGHTILNFDCSFNFDRYREQGELILRVKPGMQTDSLNASNEIMHPACAFLDFFTLEESSMKAAAMLCDPVYEPACNAVLDALRKSQRIFAAKPFEIKRARGEVTIDAIQPKAISAAKALAPMLAQSGDAEAAIALIEAIHADALERAKTEPDVRKARRLARAARLTMIRSTIRSLIGVQDADPGVLGQALSYLDELAKSRKAVNEDAAGTGRAVLAKRMRRLYEAGIVGEDRACDHLIGLFRCATASTDEKVMAHGGWAMAELIKLNKASGKEQYSSFIEEFKETHAAILAKLQRKMEAEGESERGLKLDTLRLKLMRHGYTADLFRNPDLVLPIEKVFEFCGLALDPKEGSMVYVEAESLCQYLAKNAMKLDAAQITRLASLFKKIALRHAQDGAIDQAMTALVDAGFFCGGKQAERRVIENVYVDIFSICRQMKPVAPDDTPDSLQKAVKALQRQQVKALERLWISRCLNRLRALPLDTVAAPLGLLVQLFANGLGGMNQDEVWNMLSPIALQYDFKDVNALVQRLESAPKDNNDLRLLSNHFRDETLDMLVQLPFSFGVGKMQEVLGITPCLRFAKSSASLAQLTPESVRIEQRRLLLENVPKLLSHATYEKYDKTTATASSPAIRENHRIAWALHELMMICTPEESETLDASIRNFSAQSDNNRLAMQDIQAKIDFRIALAWKNGTFIESAIKKYPRIIADSADLAPDRATMLLDATEAMLGNDAQTAAEALYVAADYEPTELPRDLQPRAESVLGSLLDQLPIESVGKRRSQTHVLLTFCVQLSTTAGWVPVLGKLARRANNLQADPKHFGNLCCSLASAHFNQGELEQGEYWLKALVKAGSKFKCHREAANNLRKALEPCKENPHFPEIFELIRTLEKKHLNK